MTVAHETWRPWKNVPVRDSLDAGKVLFFSSLADVQGWPMIAEPADATVVVTIRSGRAFTVYTWPADTTELHLKRLLKGRADYSDIGPSRVRNRITPSRRFTGD